LFTQTIIKLTPYGESTNICGELLQVYCSNKNDHFLDPGCFVQGTNGVLYPPKKLRFSSGLDICEHSDCFGRGLNFGAAGSNSSCLNEFVKPFQNQSQLAYQYGKPNLITSRAKTHRMYPVCPRIECTNNEGIKYNVNKYWIILEFVVNGIFSLELLLRVAVTESFTTYCKDKMNFSDIVAIAPFYVELIRTYSSGKRLDFSILASSPLPIVYVVIRAFKVEHFFLLSTFIYVLKS
jgi:hypothetical protein